MFTTADMIYGTSFYFKDQLALDRWCSQNHAGHLQFPKHFVVPIIGSVCTGPQGNGGKSLPKMRFEHTAPSRHCLKHLTSNYTIYYFSIFFFQLSNLFTVSRIFLNNTPSIIIPLEFVITSTLYLYCHCIIIVVILLVFLP